jgi:glycerol-3-phosphate dehydrogenase
LPDARKGSGGWTGKTPLPGGDFPMQGFEPQLAAARLRYPFLAEAHLRRLFRAYGTRMEQILAGATSMADLGAGYGGDLTEAELHYLVRAEWARAAPDVLWRRSKLGLRLTQAEAVRVDEALQRILAARETAAA